MISIPGIQLVIPGDDWTFAPVVPDSEEKIWRYLDLAKLASLIQTKALFFPRADSLGDPLEGGWSDTAVDRFRAYAGDDYVDTALSIHRLIRKRSWISCWHASAHENEALWRLYSRDNQGVAIQSTLSRLTQVVPVVSPNCVTEDQSSGIRCVELTAVSRVHYLDYSTEGPHLNNTIGPLICKRAAFAHEREVRAIIQSLPFGEESVAQSALEGAPGLSRGIDVEQFVENIYVDPLAPDWFVNVVQSLVRQYDLSVPVTRSKLWSAPAL